MQLRNQLLSYFFTLILAVLLIFGWNAYRFTHDSVNEIELDMSQAFIDRYVRMLSNQYDQAGPSNQLTNLLPKQTFNNSNVILLVYRDTGLLVNANVPESIIGLTKMIIANKAGAENHGQLKYRESTYQWRGAAIVGSPYNLLIVQNMDNLASPVLLKRLSTRLLAIGLTVLWVAIWIALIISTIVSRKLNRQQQDLVELANNDRLTGLPNRHQAHKLLNKAIKKASDSGESVACIILDINRFKEINDALGHDLGDKLLQTMAERLQNALWQDDIITRFGGDEFALILKLSDENHITQIVHKISDLSDEPMIINRSPLLIETTLGVATYPKDGGDAESIMRKAEVAMYSARKLGSTFDYYRAEHDPRSRQRLQITAELQGAHEREELELHYQPQIDFQTGHVIGVEALCRWKHPQKGFISPMTFIPAAEETGIIVPMTKWVLQSSLQHCKQWNEQGHNLKVSVNLSARMLHNINLPGTIAEILRDSGLSAKHLELEITETALMIDPTAAVEILTLISGMGVQLSLDDFGSGYMSLSYLRNMPVDTIKIDMSFIRNMLIDDDDRTIVNTIIDLGHNLGCKVVAEGVENRDTYTALENMNCDAVQGYYISQPLPAKDFAKWLVEYKNDRPIRSLAAD